MIRVAPAGPADVLALTELLEEMDRFYGAAGFYRVEDTGGGFPIRG